MQRREPVLGQIIHLLLEVACRECGRRSRWEVRPKVAEKVLVPTMWRCPGCGLLMVHEGWSS